MCILNIKPDSKCFFFLKASIIDIRITTISIDIDLLRKSYDAPVPYLTMHRFVAEYTRVHISVTKYCSVLNLFDNSLRSSCVGNLTIIGSDHGLSPGRRQATVWTNAGVLLIEPLGKNFSEIIIEIITFSFEKMRLKVSSVKRQPFCLGLNVLMHCGICAIDLLITVDNATAYIIYDALKFAVSRFEVIEPYYVIMIHTQSTCKTETRCFET